MKRHRKRETLYYVSLSSLSTRPAFERDAERRAKERGCTCPRPVFNLLGESVVQTVVFHTDAACALRAEL